MKPYENSDFEKTPGDYQEVIQAQLSLAIQIMQSFLTKNGLDLGNLAPIYVQYPIKPTENN